jgi:hypothetical protein
MTMDSNIMHVSKSFCNKTEYKLIGMSTFMAICAWIKVKLKHPLPNPI